MVSIWWVFLAMVVGLVKGLVIVVFPDLIFSLSSLTTTSLSSLSVARDEADKVENGLST